MRISVAGPGERDQRCIAESAARRRSRRARSRRAPGRCRPFCQGAAARRLSLHGADRLVLSRGAAVRRPAPRRSRRSRRASPSRPWRCSGRWPSRAPGVGLADPCGSLGWSACCEPRRRETSSGRRRARQRGRSPGSAGRPSRRCETPPCGFAARAWREPGTTASCGPTRS